MFSAVALKESECVCVQKRRQERWEMKGRVGERAGVGVVNG